MADAALFTGWGDPVRGREQKGLEIFNEALTYWGQQQESGGIESFEVVFLYPHGGDLAGFILAKGSQEQIAAIQASEEFDPPQRPRRPDRRQLRRRRRRRRRRHRQPGPALPGGDQRSRLSRPPSHPSRSRHIPSAIGASRSATLAPMPQLTRPDPADIEAKMRALITDAGLAAPDEVIHDLEHHCAT
jgi:hypothetical protein